MKTKNRKAYGRPMNPDQTLWLLLMLVLAPDGCDGRPFMPKVGTRLPIPGK